MGGLQTGLKRRHVTMIALGGVIGAGLFVGSGAVINQTGPAAVLSYLIAGILVVLVMRMLGEMAVANPSTGSFADYARLSSAPTNAKITITTPVSTLPMPSGECLNSGIYVASRMMFALAKRGDAPRWTVEINDRGVPARAIVLATSVGVLSVIFAALWPETIFLWLVNSSGAVALFVYLLIAVSQLRMRARVEREDPEKLQVRMWATRS
jgi:GABA permease